MIFGLGVAYESCYWSSKGKCYAVSCLSYCVYYFLSRFGFKWTLKLWEFDVNNGDSFFRVYPIESETYDLTQVCMWERLQVFSVITIYYWLIYHKISFIGKSIQLYHKMKLIEIYHEASNISQTLYYQAMTCILQCNAADIWWYLLLSYFW